MNNYASSRRRKVVAISDWVREIFAREMHLPDFGDASGSDRGHPPLVSVRSSNGGQHDELIESVIEERERPIYHFCVLHGNVFIPK